MGWWWIGLMGSFLFDFASAVDDMSLSARSRPVPVPIVGMLVSRVFAFIFFRPLVEVAELYLGVVVCFPVRFGCDKLSCS
jgi:hypothetical protein